MSKSTSAISLQQLSDSLADVVDRAAPSIVAVHSARSRSSGFVWRPGLIVTADEALDDEGDIAVMLPGGDTAAATIVGRDPSTDVALLRVDRPHPPSVTLKSAALQAGALAWAVGSVQGAPLAAFGTVSLVGGAWRSLRGGEIDARIELDLSLRRAVEGGVALDASGSAFGMVVSGARRQVLVIPAATVERVAARLETHGRVARGYLGLGLQPIKLDGDSGYGVMVVSVDPKGPGAAAGVRQGDVITKWNDQQTQDVRMILRALGPDSVGSTVKLALRRGGEPAEVQITLSERPEP
ncbi:MAG TPA: S1C family serine protease [Steroidobacteraceae bacterium]|jgi:S1-C subfamily serine protease|nr:S1C family serine protease [Steroidobacteraceae bacterium]